MQMEYEMDKRNRKEIAEGLSKLLAETYTLYLKTQFFHWNVKGIMFQTLHFMFESQYMEMATAIDAIAERIRTLGFQAPGSFTEFMKLSKIKESTVAPPAIEMITQLIDGHKIIDHTARSVLLVISRYGDEPSCDLLAQRMTAHEKATWMLGSLIED